MLIQELAHRGVVDHRRADVGRQREHARLRRIRTIAWMLAPVAALAWWNALSGDPIPLGLPTLPPAEYMFPMVLISVLVLVILVPMVGSGRSPHVRYDPSELDLTFDDVRGAETVKEEVHRTLNLFLAHKVFRDTMGGTPRRAILFEGPPGTGKTHMAKAMAAEAGVPFLFVSASAFQSMYYGQTNRKIRSYFNALRKTARTEGGAIGFIEELDAIGSARRGMGGGGREGVSGVVNELLIQLQSFDAPPPATRFRNGAASIVNRFLPEHRRIARRAAPPANILVAGATNRAADLDPALVRPGRFDRTVHFGLPNRSERIDLIDHFLARRAHEPELDEPDRREALAGMTFGYTPVMLEHVFDEALVWALRRGAERLDWGDVQQAKFTEELGLKQPVEYEPGERIRIASHEAGHAVVAHYVGRDRRLEVLSIIKRSEALGLLAHSDVDERYTRNRSELFAMLEIAFGGMVAEELLLGEFGTGPSGDLHAATTIAAKMVGVYGMAGSLISVDAAEVGGAGNVVAKVLAQRESREAVERILVEARGRAAELVAEKRHVLVALRDALLDHEELIGHEILEVIAAAEDGILAVDPVG